MTYHERELLVSRSPQNRTFNHHNHRWYSSRLSSSPSLRIQCQADERHFLNYTTAPHYINSSFQSIRFAMNEQTEPLRFRSEIVVHSHPDVDLHIKRLRVNFHYPDDVPINAIVDHRPSTLPEDTRHQSKHLPRSTFLDKQRESRSRRKSRPESSQSQAILHRWIDDLCANEQLMANDDIVFFIKNGEFFARI